MSSWVYFSDLLPTFLRRVAIVLAASCENAFVKSPPRKPRFLVSDWRVSDHQSDLFFNPGGTVENDEEPVTDHIGKSAFSTIPIPLYTPR